jgi:hypothetical protein
LALANQLTCCAHQARQEGHKKEDDRQTNDQHTHYQVSNDQITPGGLHRTPLAIHLQPMKPTGGNPQNGIIPANLLRELERSTPFSERSGSASGPQALRLETAGFQGPFMATAHHDDLAQLCGRNGADAD